MLKKLYAEEYLSGDDNDGSDREIQADIPAKDIFREQIEKRLDFKFTFCTYLTIYLISKFCCCIASCC